MRQQQYLRLLQQICYLLKLSHAATKTAVQYFSIFKDSLTHKFQHEIMIASCIFLVTKIFEENTKIRDILNIIYTCTTLYKKAQMEVNEKESENSAEEKDSYLSLEKIVKEEGIFTIIQPPYDFQEYQKYKEKIFEAEQHLLRIINYDVGLANNNLNSLKRLLVLLNRLQFPKFYCEVIVKVYNDVSFSQLEEWLPGILFFGVELAKAQIVVNLENSQNVQQTQGKETLIPPSLLKQEQWEEFFCLKMAKLKRYADQLANFYEFGELHQDQKSD